MQNKKDQKVNKIIISIIIITLIVSVFSINTYATGDTTQAKLASIIYRDYIDNEYVYYLISHVETTTSRDRSTVTLNGNSYITEYRKFSSNITTAWAIIPETNKIILLTSNSTWQYLTIDEEKNLLAAYRITNGYFQLGFTTPNDDININDYEGIYKSFAVAWADKYVSGTNSYRYSLEYFTLSTSNTILEFNSIITGNVGDVYQGVISDDNVIYSTYSKYHYSIDEQRIIIDWGIQSNISGIDYNVNGLYLNYMLDHQKITIPDDGNNATYNFNFGELYINNRTTANNGIFFTATLNGSIYISNATPLEALVTQLVLQAFDIQELQDTLFIWATKADINQELSITIIDNQLTLIGLLENGDTSVIENLDNVGSEIIDNISEEESMLGELTLEDIDIESAFSEVNVIINQNTIAQTWFKTDIWTPLITLIVTIGLGFALIAFILFGRAT